ncbi:MAG: hypothetical protein ACQESR_10400 [Planctomycetota bacterium]
MNVFSKLNDSSSAAAGGENSASMVDSLNVRTRVVPLDPRLANAAARQFEKAAVLVQFDDALVRVIDSRPVRPCSGGEAR